MQLMEQEIQRVTAMIWESILRLPLEPGPVVASAGQHVVSAFVHINGAWNGAVVLDCGVEFARRAAGIMFSLGDEPATPADIQDALGELANMIGGNIKGLCPEVCWLSLPVVVEGIDCAVNFPGARLLTKVPFCSGRYPLAVSLHKREEKNAA
jgi:chemotaxis protein CheX